MREDASKEGTASADVVVQVFTLTSTDPTRSRTEMHETAGAASHATTAPLKRLCLVAISQITMMSLTNNRASRCRPRHHDVADTSQRGQHKPPEEAARRHHTVRHGAPGRRHHRRRAPPPGPMQSSRRV